MPTEDTGRKGKRPAGNRRRAEQARALNTRLQILDAAVDEFGERGFDGANVRQIAKRCGIRHQLIIYHFENKEMLWYAAAVHVFDQALAIIAETRANPEGVSATESLRLEMRRFIAFQLEHAKLHRFILQEMSLANPRLPWLIERYLAPIRKSQARLIEAAQTEGGVVAANPDIMFYMIVGLTTVIPSVQEEIRLQGTLSPDASEIAKQVWPLLERMMFIEPSRNEPVGKNIRQRPTAKPMKTSRPPRRKPARAT